MEARSWINGSPSIINREVRIAYNPSNLTEEVGAIYYGEAMHVFDAEESARASFQAWSQLSGAERGNFLFRMAQSLKKQKKELATLSSREMGKPIAEMLTEISQAIQLLNYYAAESVKANGNVYPVSKNNMLQYCIREPLGVIAVITPWSSPVLIPIQKIAPALICGNTIIWKPADNGSLTAAKMMEIFQEAELPKGVLNLVIGKGTDVGSIILEKIQLHCISFSGSTETGLKIATSSFKRNIKFQTEKSGKNTAIILKDVDLDKTVPLILNGAFRSAGQRNAATSLIIVEKDIYESFIMKFKAVASYLKAENALHPSACLGPVATKSQYESIMDYVQLAKHDGEILAEGMINKKENGFYIAPMLIGNLPVNHTLVQAEIFGPLAVILQASDFDEAIALTNEKVNSLSASIFTNNLYKAHQFLSEAKSKLVFVNRTAASSALHSPYTEMNQANFSTYEFGQAALQFFTSSKTCEINHPL